MTGFEEPVGFVVLGSLVAFLFVGMVIITVATLLENKDLKKENKKLIKTIRQRDRRIQTVTEMYAEREKEIYDFLGQRGVVASGTETVTKMQA